MSIATETQTLIKGPRESRKFPRLTTPKKVRIGNVIYPVLNWSTHGIAIGSINREFASGKVVGIELLHENDDATIRIDLIAKVVWCNTATQKCGLQFVDPEPRKVALMNDVLDFDVSQYGKKSVALAFGKTELDKEAAAPRSVVDRIKRIIGLCLFAVVGISSVLFLGKMIYDRMFLFEAASASVFSEAVGMTSPADGIVKDIIGVGSVKNGQVLAKIDLTTGGSAEVLSSCDCETASILKRSGSFVRAGETVVDLVKSDAKPVVSVRIAFHDLERVVKGASLSLLYVDGTAVKGARILQLPKIVDDSSSLVTLYVDAGRALTPSQVGEPVYAVVDTGPW